MLISSLLKRLQGGLLFRNASWVFLGQGLSLVAQTLYFLLLARLLGTEQYGLLAGGTALVMVMSQYSTLGSGLVFLRYVSSDPELFGPYWGNILLSLLFCGLLTVGILTAAGGWLVGAQSGALLLPLAIGECLLAPLGLCASQVFQAFDQMRYSALLATTVNVSRCLLAALMLGVLGRTSALTWSVVSLAVSLLSSTLAFAMVTRQFGFPTFSLRLFVRRSVEGFIFALSGSTTAVYNDVDKVVLSHYGLERANGIYSMAYRVVNVATMPISSIMVAAFPSFFRAGDKGIAATVPMAKRLLKFTAPTSIMMSLGMFVLAPLLPLLVGRSYTDSVPALRWLCLIPIFRCFHLSAGDALAGAGCQKYRLLSQATAAASNLLLNIVLVPRYSWVGAALASLATDAALALFNWTALFLLARRAVSLLPPVKGDMGEAYRAATDDVRAQ